MDEGLALIIFVLWLLSIGLSLSIGSCAGHNSAALATCINVCTPEEGIAIDYNCLCYTSEDLK